MGVGDSLAAVVGRADPEGERRRRYAGEMDARCAVPHSSRSSSTRSGCRPRTDSQSISVGGSAQEFFEGDGQSGLAIVRHRRRVRGNGCLMAGYPSVVRPNTVQEADSRAGSRGTLVGSAEGACVVFGSLPAGGLAVGRCLKECVSKRGQRAGCPLTNPRGFQGERASPQRRFHKGGVRC